MQREQGGLAAAVAAEDDDQFARFDGQIEIGKRQFAVRVAQRKLTDFQHFAARLGIAVSLSAQPLSFERSMFKVLTRSRIPS